MCEPTENPTKGFLTGRHPGLLGFARFLGDTRGATAIEYAMIGGLIFAVIAGTLKLYGAKLDGVYDRIGTTIAQVN
ncbi:Flp family type IVb pilin [Methylobacterium komagatae]